MFDYFLDIKNSREGAAAGNLIDCPYIICSGGGVIIYFSDKVQNTLLTSHYTQPVYEYMPENDKSRFIAFLDSQTTYMDADLCSFGSYKCAFAVKNTITGKSSLLVNMYLFTSREEMVNSGITADFMYELFTSYIKNISDKISRNISSSIEEAASGSEIFPESLGAQISNFIKLTRMNTSVQEVVSKFEITKISCSVDMFIKTLKSVAESIPNFEVNIDFIPSLNENYNMKIDTSGFPIMIGGLISVLAELSCDNSIKIFIASSGDSLIIDMLTTTADLPVVMIGGTLNSLAQTLPSCEIRIIMCNIIAAKCNYDITCSAYIENDGNTENTRRILKFSIALNLNSTTDTSLKITPYFNGISEEIAENIASVFSGLIN